MTKHTADMVNMQQIRARESLESMLVYAALINAGRPLTCLELIQFTEVNNGLLYRLLQMLVNVGLLVEDESDHGSTYDLTADGYSRAEHVLGMLQVEPALWARARRNASGHLKSV